MKILMFAIVLTATLGFAACGSDSASKTPTKASNTPASQTQASPSTGGVKPAGSPSPNTQPSAPAAAQSSTPAALSDGNAPGIPPLTGNIQSTPDGLRYLDEKVGDGASPVNGQNVTVQYTGWLTDGTKFDSSRDRNQPFSFPIGKAQVIKGWDEGVLTMKVGGKRRLIIPAALAYGPQARPPKIPANSVLIFDVELVSVP